MIKLEENGNKNTNFFSNFKNSCFNANIEELLKNENVGENVDENVGENVGENVDIDENEIFSNTVPDTIFIIPYRDRKEHLYFFNIYMKHILEEWSNNSYEIYFAHQVDNRPFNRGAMKNLGFLAIKDKYPNDYHNITFIFHDVDTIPYKKNLLSYKTTQNHINHFYGFKFALGGIFAIKGCDFEKINGFPNIWGWGLEDNEIQNRALNNGMIIDRNEFFESGSKSILQFIDGIKKTIINRQRPVDIYNDYKNDGINTLKNINYDIVIDNNINIGKFINITNFNSLLKHSDEKYELYDVVKNKGKIYSKTPLAGSMKSILSFRR